MRSADIRLLLAYSAFGPVLASALEAESNAGASAIGQQKIAPKNCIDLATSPDVGRWTVLST